MMTNMAVSVYWLAMSSRLAKILLTEHERLGNERFIARIHRSILACYPGQKLQEILNAHKARAAFRDAIRARRVENFDKLAEALTRLRIRITVDPREEPWNRIDEGAKICILLGYRDSDHGPEFPTVSARDFDGVNAVINLINHELHARYLLELRQIPLILTPDQSCSEWADIKKQNYHAIICLGSSRSNGLSGLIAKEILGSNEAPAYFQHLKCNPEDPLSGESINAKPGVRERKLSGDAGFHERTPVDQNIGGTKRDFIYRDVGLLLIDASRPDTVLILAAGHGSIGTLGCVNSLFNDKEQINRRLEQSRNGYSNGGIGENKVFEIVKSESARSSSDTRPNKLELKRTEWAWPPDAH